MNMKTTGNMKFYLKHSNDNKTKCPFGMSVFV